MPSPARFKDLVLDVRDHQGLADWWCATLGYRRRHAPPGQEWLESWPVLIFDPDGHGPMIWLVPVPEPKAGKNRMHLDVWGDTAELLARGATLLRGRDEEIDWDVLADPEGNEFCVFKPPADKPYVPLTVR
jgi:hypothetical protein